MTRPKPGARAKARKRYRCPRCERWILIGDPIVKTGAVWSHEICSPAPDLAD
jgi:hypothetical protein